MNTDRIPHPVALPNKPLGEAIFELRWALDTTDQGLHHDPGFRILLGRYYDGLREHYPHIQDLPISQMPDDMAASADWPRYHDGQ